MKNLAAMFLAGKIPSIKEMDGVYSVKLTAWCFPAVQILKHQKFFPKEVSKKPVGSNRFLNRFSLGHFRIEKGISALRDHLEVLKIVYDDPKNPFYLRRLTDELREIGPQKYLGRGVYKIFGHVVRLFYFTVEKLDR